MVTSSHAFRCFVVLLIALSALELASCHGAADNDSDAVGTIAQALTDTDSDGMDDGWEVMHFGNLSATSAGDADSDGMTNVEEYLSKIASMDRAWIGQTDPVIAIARDSR